MKRQTDEQLVISNWKAETQDFRLAVSAAKERWRKQNHQPLEVTCVPSPGMTEDGTMADTAGWLKKLTDRLDALEPADLFAAIMTALTGMKAQRPGWGRSSFRLRHGGTGSCFVAREDGVPFVRLWNPQTHCSVTWAIVCRPKDRPLRIQPNRPKTYRTRRDRLMKAHWDVATKEGQTFLPGLEVSTDDKEGGQE